MKRRKETACMNGYIHTKLSTKHFALSHWVLTTLVGKHYLAYFYHSEIQKLATRFHGRSIITIWSVSFNLLFAVYSRQAICTGWKNVYSRNLSGVPGGLSHLKVWLLISAQVMTLSFMRSSPTLGSVLTAQSLFGILSPSLCSSLTCAHTHVLSLSK